MNSAFGWININKDDVKESYVQRERLRDKLALHQWLARREVFQVGEGAVHCELYEHAADAPVLLFLPGLGTYCELYAELLGRVSETGFNVVGVDMRGHGYSKGERGDYRVEQVVEDLQQVIDHLQARFSGPVGVYGYSIGGLLAAALAERDDRVQSILCGTLLLTEEPPDFLHQLGWSWTWGSAMLFPSWKLPLKSVLDYDRLLASHPAREEIKNDPRLIYDYPLGTLASLFTYRSGVMQHAYDFKAAIIHGSRDDVLSIAYSERIIKAMKHPFTLIPVEDGGHMLPWDDPKLLAEMTTDWFTKTLT